MRENSLVEYHISTRDDLPGYFAPESVTLRTRLITHKRQWLSIRLQLLAFVSLDVTIGQATEDTEV